MLKMSRFDSSSLLFLVAKWPESQRNKRTNAVYPLSDFGSCLLVYFGESLACLLLRDSFLRDILWI